jgi:hypothetical protein
MNPAFKNITILIYTGKIRNKTRNQRAGFLGDSIWLLVQQPDDQGCGVVVDGGEGGDVPGGLNGKSEGMRRS